MKTLTAIILISSMAFSQTKCVIDPEEVDLLQFGKIPIEESTEFWVNEVDTIRGLISYSWLKVDSVFHNGKNECLHEWRENKPDFSKIRYIKGTESDTIKTESKCYVRLCAKCIRREAVREESRSRVKKIPEK